MKNKANAAEALNVVREALLHYQAMCVWSLDSLHATGAERELARIKIALIEAELAK